MTGMIASEFPVIPLRRFIRDLVDGPFGSALTSSHYADYGARVIRLGNIGSACFRQSDEAYISLDYYQQLRRHQVVAGDLIIAGLGDSNHPVGRACLAPEGLGPAIVKADCFRARLHEGRVLHRYAKWALSSSAVSQQIRTLTRGTTRTRINLDIVREIQLPVPNIAEQRRIADFLDAETARIDQLVTTLQRELDLLAERRAAGVVAAVSGSAHTDRRSSTLPWLESVPTAWQEVRLGLLARMGSGHTPSRSHPEWWTDSSIPWITTGEVKQVRDDRVEDLYETREKISKLGLANSAAELHPRGTVFLCRTASAGYSGVMGLDMATSQDFVTWTCGPRLTPHFLLWCLRAMRPDLLGRLAMGSTHKTIYVPDLQMLRIPLPPLDEQEKIVYTIRRQNARIDSLTDRVRRQQELLRERRQALITAAVTGQFDVTTASGRNVTEGVTA
ncbi:MULTISPECIES: restriction endonuclease subunit S [unclassified Streptomyces]|uniref:restriction endonuclease subunit S n=1 Tax=Streptomyces TaxID=1883 RepID=UPI000D1420DB|nr:MULTISPECIES: restriction endonuclease subunit S [unclassified Streptomyces]